MDTLGSIILGVVLTLAGGALIALTYNSMVAPRIRELRRSLGPGTSPADILQVLRTQMAWFPNPLETMAKLMGLALLLLALKWWIMPPLVYKYSIQGGPTWVLYLLLIAGYLVWSSTNKPGGAKVIGAGLMAVGVGAAMVYTVIALLYGADITRGAAQAVVQPPPSPNWDRQVEDALHSFNQNSNSACDNKRQRFVFTTEFKEIPHWQDCTVVVDAPGHYFQVKVEGSSASYPKTFHQEHAGVIQCFPPGISAVAGRDVNVSTFEGYITLMPREVVGSTECAG